MTSGRWGWWGVALVSICAGHSWAAQEAGRIAVLNSEPWYFPGDGPVFELFGVLGGLAFAVGLIPLVLSLVIGRQRRDWLVRLIRWLARGPAILGVALLAIASVGVLNRHFGEWAKLKAALVEQSERVRARASDPTQLSPEEFQQLNQELMTPPPSFTFRAMPEPVHIRIMQTVPPFVGVDFGYGANAVFDLTTMVCTYSD